MKLTKKQLQRRIQRDRHRRKYYCKCGICGERYEQSEMIRTDESPNGWICEDCRATLRPEYDCDE